MLTCSWFNCWLVGDLHFEAQRRFWSQTTAAPSFTYIFTDPQPSVDPALGVFHSSELAYLFGNSPAGGSPKSARLSRAMLDFWISFAVSLTPNDGKGTRSAFCHVSIFLSILTLPLGPHWGMYGETEVRVNSRTSGKLMNLPYRVYLSLTASAWK